MIEVNFATVRRQVIFSKLIIKSNNHWFNFSFNISAIQLQPRIEIICFSHCKSTHYALCICALAAVGFSNRVQCPGQSSGQKIANSTSNGQNQRDLIE